VNSRTNRQHDEAVEEAVAAGERRYAESFDPEVDEGLAASLRLRGDCGRCGESLDGEALAELPGGVIVHASCVDSAEELA
jgi:hypothetical protein